QCTLFPWGIGSILGFTRKHYVPNGKPGGSVSAEGQKQKSSSKCCPLCPERWGNRPTSLWIAEELGAALQADGETRSAYAASSIRRRSAAWTILLDSTCRSRKRASASWMMRARLCGK